MEKKDIALKYLEYLENGDIDKILGLFSENGIVESPVYGVKNADKFYRDLNDDTLNSELHLNGIFEQSDTNNLALYFNYKWTLKNNQIVDFDVVDIIELDSDHKIKKLKIIYDTVVSSKLVAGIRDL